MWYITQSWKGMKKAICRDMDGPVIQSEVSQKKKDKYWILTHIYGIQKDGTDKPICRAAMETQIQHRLVDTVREGEGVMN